MAHSNQKLSSLQSPQKSESSVKREKNPSAESSIYDIPLESIEGKSFSLKDFKGKVILIVNTASHCGFTPQYQSLQKLFTQYEPQGLIVLGAPCNQFGAQEPGSAQEIKHFCERRYGVKFPLLKKLEVNGSHRHALYHHLLSHSNEAGDIEWNFEKFLIGKSGRVLKRFKSPVDPLSHESIQAIEAALKE